MGDEIAQLPTAPQTSSVDQNDIDTINALFKNKEQANKVAWEFKDALLGGVLFLVIANPLMTNAIYAAGCKNELMMWTVKFLIFIIAFYILKNRLLANSS